MAETELRSQIADLEAELESVRGAKASADEHVLSLERKNLMLEASVAEARRQREVLRTEIEETLRAELGEEMGRETRRHEELRELLAARISDKDLLIASLRAQLESSEARGDGHGRIEAAVAAETRPPTAEARTGERGVGDVEEGEGTPTGGGETTPGTRAGRPMKLPALPTFDGNSREEGAYKRWVAKIGKHTELLHWSDRDQLLQFELHLTGKAERVYEVLPPEEKQTFASATEALGRRIQPAKREALASAQLLRRKQKAGESVDDYVREFERLFEDSYGHRADIDAAFKAVLKRDLFVQGLLLKWQEKVLPTTKAFPDALHLARTAEEQERQLGLMHHRHNLPRKDGAGKDPVGKQPPKELSGQSPEGQQPAHTSKNWIRCYRCQGLGHRSRECPLRKSTEARGSTGETQPGSSSTVTAADAEDPSDRCRRLQQEWADAEFARLSKAYTPEVPVDAVKGALGPLWYAEVNIAGTPVRAMVDTGSSATIIAFPTFQKIGAKAAIPRSALRKPSVTLKDYSRRPIPIFAEVDLEISHQGKKTTATVYLRSDQGTGGESCLLGTNVLVDLGLVFPGLGVETSGEGVRDGGIVRLIKAERVPSRCGVVVEAMVEGRNGAMLMVEPVQDESGLELEPMLVQPGLSGKVCIVICNPSPEVVHLKQGQLMGSAHHVSEGQVNGTGMWIGGDVVTECGDVCVNPDGVRKRKEKLSELLKVGNESGVIREKVLEAHDMFAIDEGERGEVREVQHEIVTGDSPPIRAGATSAICTEGGGSPHGG
jgi:hypothetical protein